MKGLSIAALVIAIVAIFIPGIGVIITILSGLMAVFASRSKENDAFAFSLAAVIINIVSLLFMSPILWAAMALAGHRDTGEGIFTGIFYVGIQLASLGGIIFFYLQNKKILEDKSQDSE